MSAPEGVPGDIIFGSYTTPGSLYRNRLRLAAADLWSTHILGAPGYGKSTLQGNLAEQSLAANEGGAIMDPHGTLARTFVALTRFPERVTYLSPGETPGHTWALNPFDFDRADAERRKIVVDIVVGLFARIGAYTPDEMARINKHLRMAARLALADPDATMLSLYRILWDEDYREALMVRSDADELACQHWARHRVKRKGPGSMSMHDHRLDVDSTDSRLVRLFDAEPVKYLLGQPKATLHLGDLMDAGRMVVVNLDTNLSGETGRLFGNVLLAYIVQLMHFRPENPARRWRIFIDEYDELAPIPATDITFKGRKRNVFSCTASQSMAQIDTPATKELYAAAESSSVIVELRASRTDQDITKRRYGQEEAERRRKLESYTAHIELAVGSRKQVKEYECRLRPWFNQTPDAAQRDAIIAAATRGMTPIAGLADPWAPLKRLREGDTTEAGRSAPTARAAATTNGAPHGHQTRDTSRPHQDRQSPRQTVGLPADPAGAGRAVPPGSVRGADQRANRPRPVLPPTQPTTPPAKPRKRPESGQ